MSVILLDWRVAGEAGVIGHSAVVADAAGALSVVGGVARTAVYGEYRVIVDGGAPVFVTAAGIRAWVDAGCASLQPMPRSLWRREVDRAAAIEALIASLRADLGAAARRGLLPDAAVAVIVDTAIRSAMAGDGPEWPGMDRCPASPSAAARSRPPRPPPAAARPPSIRRSRR